MHVRPIPTKKYHDTLRQLWYVIDFSPNYSSSWSPPVSASSGCIILSRQTSTSWKGNDCVTEWGQSIESCQPAAKCGGNASLAPGNVLLWCRVLYRYKPTCDLCGIYVQYSTCLLHEMEIKDTKIRMRSVWMFCLFRVICDPRGIPQ